MQDLEFAACNLCGVDEVASFIEFPPWRVVRCRGCGLVYLNPRPPAEGLFQLYDTNYFAGLGEAGRVLYTAPTEDAEIRRLVVAQEWRWERLVQRIGPGPGRLLDVGCATGMFLACARGHGWQVEGVENAPEAARYAREQLGLTIWPGTVEDGEWSGEYFDVVTFYHSLEHLPDPLGTLRRVHKLLRPSGWVIVELPNIGSVDARLSGRRWEGLRLPFHLYHFSPVTLSRLLTAAGFRVVAVDREICRVLRRLFRRPEGIPSAPPPSVPGGRARRFRALVRTTLGRVCPGRDMRAFAQKR